MRRAPELLYTYRSARGIPIQRPGTARDFDTTAARVNLECPFAILNLDSSARGVAIQRAMQPRETQSASTRMGLHTAIQFTDANASSGGLELSVKLARHSNGVLCFVLIPSE